MKSKILIISASLLIIVLAGIFFRLQLSGNPIIPKSYDLICREKNTGNFITMENSCDSVIDCQNWVSNNCGPENSCNNEKIDCKNNRCVSIVYFKFHRRCV